MKTLKTLIRLIKDEVDKLQKELALIEDRHQKYQDEHDALELEMQREAEAATTFPEAAPAFAAYAKRTIERQRKLRHTIAVIQKEIDKKRDELLEGYSEQKKFEIALEQKQLALFQEVKRQEEKMMNEVAIRGFVRRDKE